VTEILATDPTQAGFEGEIYQAAFSEAAVLQVEGLGEVLDGVIAVRPGLGDPSFGGSDWDTIQADADEVGYEGDLSIGFMHGYVDVDIFVTGAKALEESDEDFTTEAFANLLNAGFTYEGMGNAIPAMSWPTGHFVGTACASVVRMNFETKELDPMLDLSCAPVEVKIGG
jgi:hypothetical protein